MGDSEPPDEPLDDPDSGRGMGDSLVRAGARREVERRSERVERLSDLLSLPEESLLSLDAELLLSEPPLDELLSVESASL